MVVLADDRLRRYANGCTPRGQVKAVRKVQGNELTSSDTVITPLEWLMHAYNWWLELGTVVADAANDMTPQSPSCSRRPGIGLDGGCHLLNSPRL